MSRALSLVSVPDDELLERLSTLVDRHRRSEAELVAHLAEVDARELYLGKACSSMFGYATEVLHLSEHEAYLRIACARASRPFPVLLDMLADGRLHLSAIAKLAPHLTEDSAEALLARAVHKTKREVEELVAEVAPRPDVAQVDAQAAADPAKPKRSTRSKTSPRGHRACRGSVSDLYLVCGHRTGRERRAVHPLRETGVGTNRSGRGQDASGSRRDRRGE